MLFFYPARIYFWPGRFNKVHETVYLDVHLLTICQAGKSSFPGPSHIAAHTSQLETSSKTRSDLKMFKKPVRSSVTYGTNLPRHRCQLDETFQY